MSEFDEMIDVKEDKKWARKAFLTVFSVVVAIVVAFNLIFWNVVEGSVFEEIAKIAVMAVGLGLLACGIFWVPITMLRDARRKYYPTYGKNWFKQAWKEKFGKK